ncbi:MAG: hypothetical protein HY721_15890 [Planctomycetes bacterium]|nr:hypothetical protein [Planctomycetota bacterium]
MVFAAKIGRTWRLKSTAPPVGRLSAAPASAARGSAPGASGPGLPRLVFKDEDRLLAVAVLEMAVASRSSSPLTRHGVPHWGVWWFETVKSGFGVDLESMGFPFPGAHDSTLPGEV